MNQKYLFTDESASFRTPVQPDVGDSVVLRFQTAKDDVLSVSLVHGDERLKLAKVISTGARDIYEVTIPEVTEPFRFYYEITDKPQKRLPERQEQQRRRVYYDKRGIVNLPEEEYAFSIIPGFRVPEWIQGAVMYQIFVDRFFNGDTENDVKDREYMYLNRPVRHVCDWGAPTETLDVGRFYGGDLAGVLQKLDYLQNLGVEVLYLNPIFVSPSNHKYDSEDYDFVDPHLTRIAEEIGEVLPEGCMDNARATLYRHIVTDEDNLAESNRFFAEFVEELHRRGMKLILDGVFNHCGSFNRWMDSEGFYSAAGYAQGAWQSEDSPYREFFRFKKDGSYEAWWNQATLPKLNYEDSERLQEEILRIAAKWVSPPYSVDGWRLDVAADLGHSKTFNHEFWKKFRKTVKEANPEAVILAEHYGDVSPWMKGDEWDTVMNYDAFMEPVSWFLTGMEKHSDSYRADLDGNASYFFEMMKKNMSRMSQGSCLAAMNELDNHDHSRFLTRTNRRCGRLAGSGAAAASDGVRPGVLRQAVVIQMTWPGAPTLYYGDETGVCGWTDPDSRRTYPWGNENWDLIEFYKYAIGIHKRYPALLRGSVVPLLAEKNLLAYGRFLDGECLAVFVNTDSRERTVSVELRVMGIEREAPMIRLMETTEAGYNVGKLKTRAENGRFTVKLPPVSSQIYACNLNSDMV